MGLTPFLQDWPPMQLASLSFLYVFLPFSLIVYYLFPYKSRPAVLTVISLLFYTLAQPQGLLLIAVSIPLDYAAMLMMAHCDGNEAVRRGAMWFSAAKNISIIIYAGAALQISGAPVTLGCMVYSISALDAMVSFYKLEAPYEKHFSYFALYCVFFPRLYAGPVQPYREFSPQLTEIHLNSRGLLVGFGQFIQGALKKAVFGSQLTAIYIAVKAFGPEDSTVLSAWILVFSLAFAIYFTLSGFCDMAQGLGAMFGLFLPQNFYYPYQSRNIHDFFERFNITVVSFIRRTVCGSLKGSGVMSDSLNLLILGMLAGLWFGLRVNYLIWGVYLASFLIMERYVYKKLLDSIPTLFSRAYALCVVLLGFTIMAWDTPGQTLRHIRYMLSFSSDSIGLYNNRILYLLSSNWLILLLSAFCATNAVSLFVHWLRREKPFAADVALGLVDASILVLLTAMLLH